MSRPSKVANLPRRAVISGMTSAALALLIGKRRAEIGQSCPRPFPAANTAIAQALVASPVDLERTPADCIVIGSGTAGVTAALALASKGWSVVLLEAGPFVLLESIYSGPLRASGAETRLFDSLKYDVEWHRSGTTESHGNYLIAAVGGRSIFWNGWTPRFHPEDFSLWPLEYRDLAPYYDLAEFMIGSCNERQRSCVPYNTGRLQFEWSSILQGSDIETLTPPLALDTSATGNGSINRGVDSSIARLIASGRLSASPKPGHVSLLSETPVLQLEYDRRRRTVSSVQCFHVPARRALEIQAKRTVVLAAGSLQSTRLAMSSGLPDRSGLIGANVTDHLYVKGTYDLPSGRNERYSGSVNLLVPRTSKRRFQVQIQAPSGEIVGWDDATSSQLTPKLSIGAFGIPTPSRDTRLELIKEPSNCNGLDRLKVEYQTSTLDQELMGEMATEVDRIASLLAESHPPQGIVHRQAGSAHHEAGGLAMGTDAGTSVLNSAGKFWSIDNLYVADSAAWPGQGAANPYLTITAGALRISDLMAQSHSG